MHSLLSRYEGSFIVSTHMFAEAKIQHTRAIVELILVTNVGCRPVQFFVNISVVFYAVCLLCIRFLHYSMKFIFCQEMYSFLSKIWRLAVLCYAICLLYKRFPQYLMPAPPFPTPPPFTCDKQVFGAY
jgi:hypothetical protein